MCDLTATYSTVLATGADLVQIRESWHELRTVRRYHLTEVQLTTLERVGHHWDDRAPALLTVQHNHVPGHLVANDLHVELSVDRGYSVMCEPGYLVGLAAGPLTPTQSQAQWTVDFVQDAMDRAAEQLLDEAGESQGHRVAVIDSGADGDFMLDMVIDEPDVVSGEDNVGHGTAVAQLISELRPNAEIHPVRVLVNNPGESRHLLLGLIAALWPDEQGQSRYDVVNVSLSRQLIDECSSSLGATMAYVRALCARSGTVPPVVAAAGNTTLQQEFGYPAALPDAVAATALDWDGESADYNVEIPDGTLVASAYGGTADEPFGTLNGGGPTDALYGTSFAAALITCRYLAV